MCIFFNNVTLGNTVVIIYHKFTTEQHFWNSKTRIRCQNTVCRNVRTTRHLTGNQLNIPCSISSVHILTMCGCPDLVQETF